MDREVNAALTKFVEMEDQINANNELEEKLDEEDSQEKAMEQVLEKYAKQASAKSLKQLKALLRKNSSAGTKNTRPPAKKWLRQVAQIKRRTKQLLKKELRQLPLFQQITKDLLRYKQKEGNLP